MNDATIRRHVEGLLREREARRAAAWLKASGQRAAPAVLEALREPRFSTSKRPPKQPFSRSGFDHLLDVAEHIAEPQFADALAPLLRSDEVEVRKRVACAAGSIGHERALSAMASALADEDAWVRAYAMMGAERALRAQRATNAFLEGLFDLLVPLLTRPSHDMESQPAKLLIQINRERASGLLLQEELLQLSNPQLGAILRAMNQANLVLPLETLRRLETALAPLAHQEPHERVYAEILLGLAKARAPEARELAERQLQSHESGLSYWAAEALAELEGVHNPSDFVDNREKECGWDGLTRPQRRLSAVWWLVAEVNNGGFSQYFFNSAGDRWRDALDGLREVGAAETAKIATEAVAVFGAEGPSEDRERRQQQLAELIDEHEETLGKLTDRFFGSKERVDEKLLLYAAANAEHFR